MRSFLLFLLSLLALSIAQAQEPPPILQKPIVFDQTRVSLTQAYQAKHYGIRSPSILIQPRIIVLHWSEYPTLEQSFQAFYHPVLAQDRPDLPDYLNVSAHYLVDRDGTIYQLMPDDWMGRHVIGLNHFAIGIENVGGDNKKPDLTPAQVKADAYLVGYLKKKYPTIHYLIGHREYIYFKNSKFWQEQNPFYLTKKADPGNAFMRDVRKLTQHLHLKARPMPQDTYYYILPMTKHSLFRQLSPHFKLIQRQLALSSPHVALLQFLADSNVGQI